MTLVQNYLTKDKPQVKIEHDKQSSEGRHFFPGNNTPQGFYSYYQYIMRQGDASDIVYLKGGPGTGKSSFMRRVGEHFTQEGEDIDWLHCSSDPDSLDGVVLRNHKVALIDATAPHVNDPIHPGAVDRIVNLGDFWDVEAIKEHRNEVIGVTKEIKVHFERCYNYLRAASAVFANLMDNYGSGQTYQLANYVIERELSSIEISIHEGFVKKAFACAFTPKGNINYLNSIVSKCEKIYILNAAPGMDATGLIMQIERAAILRGLDTEMYYCSMMPGSKVDHLVIPKIGVGIFSCNDFHSIDEVLDDETVILDLFGSFNKVQKSLAEQWLAETAYLGDQAVSELVTAHEFHDLLEQYYIPNMNFKKIDTLVHETIENVHKIVL